MGAAVVLAVRIQRVRVSVTEATCWVSALLTAVDMQRAARGHLGALA